jgi:hypothetical protein
LCDSRTTTFGATWRRWWRRYANIFDGPLPDPPPWPESATGEGNLDRRCSGEFAGRGTSIAATPASSRGGEPRSPLLRRVRGEGNLDRRCSGEFAGRGTSIAAAPASSRGGDSRSHPFLRVRGARNHGRRCSG